MHSFAVALWVMLTGQQPWKVGRQLASTAFVRKFVWRLGCARAAACIRFQPTVNPLTTPQLQLAHTHQDWSMVAITYNITRGARLPLDGVDLQRCPPKLKRLITACWEADPLRQPAVSMGCT